MLVHHRSVSHHRNVDRYTDLEAKLIAGKASEERKQKQLQALGDKESDFLKLRRTRLTLTDFITIKVIGKGAFGEVRTYTLRKLTNSIPVDMIIC
jgi:protein-serine/threonine kinase